MWMLTDDILCRLVFLPELRTAGRRSADIPTSCARRRSSNRRIASCVQLRGEGVVFSGFMDAVEAAHNLLQ
jgi:hypothetical protein